MRGNLWTDVRTRSARPGTFIDTLNGTYYHKSEQYPNLATHFMLRLLLFDVTRALRPRAGTLIRGYAAGLGRVPPMVRADLGLGPGLRFARAVEGAGGQIAARRSGDAAWLLSILSEIARRRGFGPVEWDCDDDS